MKYIDMSKTTDKVVVVTNENGIAVPVEYNSENVDGILDPVPLVHNFEFDVNNRFILLTKKIKLRLSGKELIDIRDAMSLLYPDLPQVIGEIGLCSGVDMMVNNYPEVAYAQINYFIKTANDISQVIESSHMVKSIDLGNMQPLPIHTKIE